RQREDHTLAAREPFGDALVALDGEVRHDLPCADLAGESQHLEPVTTVELEDLVDNATIGATGNPVLVPRRHPAVLALRQAAHPAADPPHRGHRPYRNRFGNASPEPVRADAPRPRIHRSTPRSAPLRSLRCRLPPGD